MDFISEIRLFAFPRQIKGWLPCDGRTLPVGPGTQVLFELIGTTFGGDGSNFKIPDLRDRVAIGNGKLYPAFSHGGEETHALTTAEMPKHRHQAVASTNASDTNVPLNHYWSAEAGYVLQTNASMSDQTVEKVGGDVPHNNMSPYLALNYAICCAGIYPAGGGGETYIGTIIPFAGKTDMKEGWLPCDGRILLKAEHEALFSLIGSIYGGDGITTFALPDLQDTALACAGYPEGLSGYRIGEKAGAATVKLNVGEMGKHNHPALASTKGNSQHPDGNMWANEEHRPPVNCFASDKGTGALMNPSAIGESGGDQPHNNMMPFQAIQYWIAVIGLYPSRG